MKYLTINKNWKIDKEYDIDKLLYLLIDRPNKIYNIGSVIGFRGFRWENNKGLWHRNYNLPSFVNSKDGHLNWYRNNKCYNFINSLNINF